MKVALMYGSKQLYCVYTYAKSFSLKYFFSYL